jgi:hypothetical protein
MEDRTKYTDAERAEFFSDLAANTQKVPLREKPERPVDTKTSPLFGASFKNQMVSRLSREVKSEYADQVYDAFEQETVTHIANLIKDSFFKLLERAKIKF